MVCLPLVYHWRFIMNQASSNTKSYFDLHTSGIGYLQRVRIVPVRGGRRAESFLACTVAALVGPAKDSTLRFFDVKVSGADAKALDRKSTRLNSITNAHLVCRLL